MEQKSKMNEGWNVCLKSINICYSHYVEVDISFLCLEIELDDETMDESNIISCANFSQQFGHDDFPNDVHLLKQSEWNT